MQEIHLRMKDIGTAGVLTVRPDDPVDRAIGLMDERGIRHLPVVGPSGVPVGMLSDRDLLRAVGGLLSDERRDFAGGPTLHGPLRVEEIMSRPAFVLAPDDPVEVGVRLMLSRKIGAIPLLNEERLSGIVTETDYLRCYTSENNWPRGSWRFRKAADVAHAMVHTLRPRDTLAKALKLLRSEGIRHVPIVAGEAVVGIVSDRDVRRALGRLPLARQWEGPAGTHGVIDARLEEIMTQDVVTAEPGEALAGVADRMVTSKIGALPVLDDGQLVGIITETDLLEVFLAACEL